MKSALLSLCEAFAKGLVKTAVQVGINAIKLSKSNSAEIIAGGILWVTSINEVMAPKTFAKTMVEGMLEALVEAQ